MNCILSIDYGTARMGFAISNKEQTLSRRLEVLVLKKITNVFKYIQKLSHEYNCEKILLGLPINLNDKETQKTKEVRDFAKVLKNYVEIPIEFVNEALTSYEAHFILRNLGFTSYKKRNRLKDSLSAQIFLQEYLDQRRIKNKQLET